MTAANPSSAGNIIVFPGSGNATLSSTVNFPAGKTRANNAIIGLKNGVLSVAAEQVSLFGTVRVIIDVSGYFR